MSALLINETFLNTFLRTQKSGFALKSAFLSGFTLLRAFLSAQKSAQGPAQPLCECPLNYFCMLDSDQISEKYEIPNERNPCVALSRPAPHFQDEIVSLKKRLFLAGF